MEDEILQHLRAKYPEGPRWQDPSFKCFKDEPIELRMIAGFNAVEYNVGNGGWSQLLWNCFASWRAVLDVAEAGYRLTESQPQVECIPSLRQILDENEGPFGQLLATTAAKRDLSWLDSVPPRRCANEPNINWGSIFGFDSGLFEHRKAWLDANKERIRCLISGRDAPPVITLGKLTTHDATGRAIDSKPLVSFPVAEDAIDLPCLIGYRTDDAISKLKAWGLDVEKDDSYRDTFDYAGFNRALKIETTEGKVTAIAVELTPRRTGVFPYQVNSIIRSGTNIDVMVAAYGAPAETGKPFADYGAWTKWYTEQCQIHCEHFASKIIAVTLMRPNWQTGRS